MKIEMKIDMINASIRHHYADKIICNLKPGKENRSFLLYYGM